MDNRFLLYRRSFIINIIAVLVLVITSIAIIGDPISTPVVLPIYNLIFFFIGALWYLITGMAGLSLLKRIEQKREISLQIVNRLSIALFVQFLIQLALAFEIFIIFKALYDIRFFFSYLPGKFLAQILIIIIPDIVIFLSASFNIYATIRLMQSGRESQKNIEMTRCVDLKNKMS